MHREDAEYDLLPGWRSLRRAQRKAISTVIYSREAFRLEEQGARRSWTNVTPVAYRASLQDPWRVDWSAMERVERCRRQRLEPGWEDELPVEDRRFLDVMRYAYGNRWRSERFGRWTVETFLAGERRKRFEDVDEAWIRCYYEGDDYRKRRYDVAIGSGTWAELVWQTDDFREAKEMAEEAIRLAREELATALFRAGGLAAEMAGCSDRWPQPRIHVVPAIVDRPYDRLRRLYEELRDKIGEDEAEG